MVLMIVRTEGFSLRKICGMVFQKALCKGFSLSKLSVFVVFSFGRLLGFLSQKTTHEFCFRFIVVVFSPFSEGFL